MEPSPALDAASGYVDLGMPLEAWRELGQLPDEERSVPEALSLRVQVLIDLSIWDYAETLSRRLCLLQPEDVGHYLDLAHCLDMRGDTRSALDVLESIRQRHEREGELHFHRARYLCVMGRLGEARSALQEAVRLDKSLRGAAKEEPDLQPIRTTL